MNAVREDLTVADISDATDAATDLVHRRIDKATQRAHDAVDKLATSAGPAIERLRSGAHDATDRLGAHAQRVSKLPDEWAVASRDTVRDNPLAAIAVAFAAGAVIAQLLRR